MILMSTSEIETSLPLLPSRRIHNTYMLASAWRIVLSTLRDLEGDGLLDQTVKIQLKKNQNLRSRYLILFDMVNDLVKISQAKFSVLATTTRKACFCLITNGQMFSHFITTTIPLHPAHYARYFKQAQGTEPDDHEVVFDWAGLRDACKSFLDSIIIELCFPRAPYPKQILYQILHDAVDESPREAKRFPQMLWDAVGDLSVSALR